jgi:hypothetical protein
MKTRITHEGQRLDFIPALGNAQGKRAFKDKGLKARPHLLRRDLWMDLAFSPLTVFGFKPRPTLVPCSGLGWYGQGRWPASAACRMNAHMTTLCLA